MGNDKGVENTLSMKNPRKIRQKSPNSQSLKIEKKFDLKTPFDVALATPALSSRPSFSEGLVAKATRIAKHQLLVVHEN